MGDKKCLALISVCIEDSEGIIFTDGKGRIVAHAAAVCGSKLRYMKVRCEKRDMYVWKTGAGKETCMSGKQVLEKRHVCLESRCWKRDMYVWKTGAGKEICMSGKQVMEKR